MKVHSENGFIKLNPAAAIDYIDTGKEKHLSAEQLAIGNNAITLQREMEWFRQVLETRLALYFENDCVYQSIEEVPVPDLRNDESSYAALIRHYQMSVSERLLLILAAIPHLRPQLLNLFLIQDHSIGKPFVEFGGWRGKTHLGFLPTGETAAFLIAGDNLKKRIEVFKLLERDHFFSRDNIISIQAGDFNEAHLTPAIVLSNECFHRITTGHQQKPDFSLNFPATHIVTNLDWQDLVLPEKVLDELEHLRTWLANQHKIMHDMGLEKSIKPGYRALFYGPPGTGKTLTASLLGKSLGLDVYRIDLSSVISKYIGETEKNLELIFSQAENRQWILFFDEADALFGKRTETNSSNDRHANQEVAYLLQRIETFPGVVILATNLRANIDDAFSRRFQSITYFPMPDVNQRHHLWRNAFTSSTYLSKSVDLKVIAKNHTIAGGSIVNAVRSAAITMLKAGRKTIEQLDLEQGIAKELKKQGRVLP